MSNSKALLAAIVESSDDAIISKTLSGIVTSWNRAAERMFGYDAKEMVGQPVAAIIPAERRAEADDILARVGQGERIDHLETVRRRKDGHLIEIAVTVSPVMDDNGRVVGASKIARDITAQRQAQRELVSLYEQLHFARDAAEKAKREAERANQAKTEFLATMSHEIRTPMNGILGLTYLALQSDSLELQRDYLRKARSAARNLLGIVNSILDFSKVEAGKLQLDSEPFDVRQIIDSVVDTAGISARAKKLAILVEVGPDVPLRVVGDALRLSQVILNLCDNAVKFTQHGHVQVQVEFVSRIGSEVELQFCVGDTGPGIPSAIQRTIFDDFTQADPSTARKHGGTGLGLAIARKLVELMGGTLGVHSQLGVGTTFHFNTRFRAWAGDAPLESVDGDELELEIAPSLRERLRGAKVMLVEDNEVNQIIARGMLESVGVEVVVANNGREALSLLHEVQDVDLVLMDCLMPVMDGLAATRAIRFDKRLSKLPVLALTANVLPDDIAMCRGAGMNDHIGKPFQAQHLYDMLDRWLPTHCAKAQCEPQ